MDNRSLASSPASAAPATATPSQADAYERYEAIFEGVAAPFAFVDLDAMWHNAADLMFRSGGKPIRVASKSVRCRQLLTAILARDRGFRGLMTYTLPETLWLSGHGIDDLL